MKINEIIKEKRNAQGLTQEQVADYLGVSTPAVNKWEKGNSYPDITLLPSLARLLRVDLNTLLSFKDDLSDQEIGNFVNEVSEIINSKGFDMGFEKAMDKIHEYPTCDKLILTVATILQGSIYMFGVENKEYYEKHIEKLYEKVVNSDDMELRNQAVSMLINKYLERKEYEKAQSCIDKLPNVTYDKKQQQGNLYVHSGEFDKAAELFEGKLMASATEITIILMFLMQIALKEKRNKDAKYLAEIIEKTTQLYDLWEYNSYAGYFHLYTEQKDAKNCIDVLKKLLPFMRENWDRSKSPLYKHIKKKYSENEFGEQLLTTFINTLKNNKDGELSFLKDNNEFLDLLNQYDHKSI